MLRAIQSIAALMVSVAAMAQISQGGEPYAWGRTGGEQHVSASVELEALDPGALENMAEVVERADARVARYGTQRPLNIDLLQRGQWQQLPDGRSVCRLLVRSPRASMISLQFDMFDPGPEVWMFIYDEARTTFIGGFTEANELPGEKLATALIPGDAVVIEVIGPAEMRATSHLHLASLTHAFRDIFHVNNNDEGSRDIDPGYQSAPCHNNVICPAAADWQTEKHASALFLRADGDGCTGQLMNNTETPGIPYFLIAHHCYSGDPAQWVFYFNYESPTCSGSSGPTTQTISGASLVAASYENDFDLLQLSSAPPASYEPYYAGWDHSGTTPTSATAILHPLYDVKKISFDYNAPTSYSNGSTQLWRTYWDSGIIEPVASGSGLYDQNHRIVGHVVDGPQDCSNAATASEREREAEPELGWSIAFQPTARLARSPNSVTALDGYDPNGTPPTQVNVQVHAMLEGPFDGGAGTMQDDLREQGLVPLTEPYTALGYPHVGGGGESTTSAVMNATGNNAVVDWVVIELRDPGDAASVVATRSALLLRNGDVVDVDGSSDVHFDIVPGNYYIALRHRNHLGAMSANAQALSGVAGMHDFTDGSMPLYGGSSAVKDIMGTGCLYTGDVNHDGTLRYVGGENDRDLILVAIGGTVPTQVATGYGTEDLNMDGVIRFAGMNNDADRILVNIGGEEPTATLSDELP